MTMTRKVLASGAVVALGAGALSVLTATSASAANVELTKKLDYTCQVYAGNLNLRTHTVGVTAKTSVPSSVSPGEVIPATPISITLALPETLRSATVNNLYGVSASGSSTDSYVDLTTAGQTTKISIPSLAAPSTPIPQNAGETWLIPATGTTPAITTPTYAVDSVVLSMPASFNIAATLVDDLDAQIPSTLACSTTGDRTLGSIPVSVPTTTPTTVPTTVPTTTPTTVPTTTPTTVPTTTPTTTPTTPTTVPTTTPTTTPTTEPTAAPVDIAFKLNGSTYIKAGKGTAPLNGGIAAKFDLATGGFTADLTLNKTTANLKALGFLPVTADIVFTPQGKTTGSLTAGKLTSKSTVGISIPSVKAFGLPLGGGASCKASSPSDITLTSTGTRFDPFKGGAVEGTYTIAKLTGCGLLNGLLSSQASGSGNTISATLAP